MRFHSQTLCILATIVVLGATACTGGGDDTFEGDTVETDTGDPCAAGERTSFIALNADAMCEYTEGCPMEDYPFASRAECVSYARTIWGQGVHWSECLAAECARWLATDPVCTSDIGAPDPSCDQMVKEDG